MRDITDRKHAESVRSEFISMISHELRTPLTSISSAVETLANEKAGPLNAIQNKFIQMAHRNIKRLGAMINDVLDFSKLEAGKMEIRAAEITVTGVLENIRETFQPEAASRALNLSVLAPSSLPTVHADALRLEQILCNLLSNALKFTREGGSVTVTARVAGESLELAIEDTGQGIAAEEIELIFQPFVQAREDPLTRTSKGTGLGLSITRQLVEAQGGTIRVESELGKGSSFIVTLPICTPRVLEMVRLEQRIDALRSTACCSIVVVAASGQGADERTAADRGLAGVLERVFPPDVGTIVHQPAWQRHVVLLPDTPKPSAINHTRRLEKELERAGASGELTADVVVYGPSSYPEDGQTARFLVERAVGGGARQERAAPARV
jgi:two-component sensor histidine kinase